MSAHHGRGREDERPTVKPLDPATTVGGDVERTVKPGGPAAGAETKTVRAGFSQREKRRTDAEAKTRIFRSASRKNASADLVATERAGGLSSSAMDNPPAGWLVVVEGPGQGRVATVGYGSNPIGRDAGERICLDFGDARISRAGHAILTYDPLGRRFYLQHGGGVNLTYLNDEPVLTPTPIEAGAQIRIADTVLRFVPLCGESFDWHAIADE